ncbi:N-acetylmuramoyl-L-alanine amidase [bacterium]|nr:N-acetylmuramoyl-L-alanine amidase [bacterium]
MIIEKRESPNYYNRGKYKPEAIIIHITEGNMPGTLSWITHKESRASYHYLIDKTGKIWNVVNEINAAWHAGLIVKPIWEFLKDKKINPNLYTIGLAFEGFGDKDITAEQYYAGQELIEDICQRNKIEKNLTKIIPHRWINGGKTCPGLVNIERLVNVKFITCPSCKKVFKI